MLEKQQELENELQLLKEKYAIAKTSLEAESTRFYIEHTRYEL
jgi:hypothetical protein